MSEPTWSEKVQTLTSALGRGPTLPELLELAASHSLTPDEIKAQRESWARGMQECEHGVLDFEECLECRNLFGGN